MASKTLWFVARQSPAWKKKKKNVEGNILRAGFSTRPNDLTITGYGMKTTHQYYTNGKS